MDAANCGTDKPAQGSCKSEECAACKEGTCTVHAKCSTGTAPAAGSCEAK